MRICVISSRKVSISDSLRMRRSAISFLRSCVSVASCSVYAFVAESAGGKPRSLRRHHVITLKMKVTTAIRPSARGEFALTSGSLSALGFMGMVEDAILCLLFRGYQIIWSEGIQFYCDSEPRKKIFYFLFLFFCFLFFVLVLLFTRRAAQGP